MLFRFHLRKRTPSSAWTPSIQDPSQSPLTNASPPSMHFLASALFLWLGSRSLVLKWKPQLWLILCLYFQKPGLLEYRQGSQWAGSPVSQPSNIALKNRACCPPSVFAQELRR